MRRLLDGRDEGQVLGHVVSRLAQVSGDLEQRLSLGVLEDYPAASLARVAPARPIDESHNRPFGLLGTIGRIRAGRLGEQGPQLPGRPTGVLAQDRLDRKLPGQGLQDLPLPSVAASVRHPSSPSSAWKRIRLQPWQK
ncbi:MAG: hypothetical protein RX316_00270 [bacterium]|nr:hypothetical protein [bacterium]